MKLVAGLRIALRTGAYETPVFLFTLPCRQMVARVGLEPTILDLMRVSSLPRLVLANRQVRNGSLKGGYLTPKES